MPVSTGPACLSSETCPIVLMPTRPASCGIDVLAGGVNDVYFIPCTQTMSQSNVLDTDWWADLIPEEGNSMLGNIGIGLGSITKKSQTTQKVGSCKGEQIVGITWALKYVIKVFDKTSADTTKAQVDAIIKRSNNFQVIARMCEGADTVLPIGSYTPSDVNWIVPEDSEDIQTLEFEITWKEFGIPKTYNVAGLSAIVPKAN